MVYEVYVGAGNNSSVHKDKLQQLQMDTEYVMKTIQKRDLMFGFTTIMTCDKLEWNK